MNDSIMPVPLTASDLLLLRSPVDPEYNYFPALHDDVLLEVFSLLDFADLVNLSHTCTTFRKQIKTMLTTRCMGGLTPFFGSSAGEVLNLLQFGGGCIYGHLVTAVLDVQLPVRDFPSDMHMLVSRRARRVLIAFLRDELHFGQPDVVALDQPTRQLAFGAYRWDLPVCCLVFK